MECRENIEETAVRLYEESKLRNAEMKKRHWRKNKLEEQQGLRKK